jgi:hypothetical protein
MSRVAGVFASLVLVSGCANAPRGKLIAGGITTTAGIVLVAHRADATCTPAGTWCDAVVAEPMNMAANAFTTGLGIGLIALGATLLVSGAMDHKSQAEPASALSATLPSRPAVLDASAEERLAMRDDIGQRLAMQASRAARTGNCAGAMTTANVLAEKDRDLYAQLLTNDDNLATCYAIQRASSEDVAR